MKDERGGEECSSRLGSHASRFVVDALLRFLGNRRKYCEELIAFIAEGGELRGRQDTALAREVQPVRRFIEFPEAFAKLGNEFGSAPGALRLAAICPD